MKIKTLLAVLVASTTITLVSCKGKDDVKPSSETTVPACEHTPNEYGVCTKCNEFVGKEAGVSEDGSVVEPLAYLASYNAYGEGIDWYRWTIAEGTTKMYVGGNYIALRHTIGLWNPSLEKVSEVGYNETYNDPAPGTWYLQVTKSADGIRDDAELKIKVWLS